jgi:hypothetical protein
VPHLLLLFLLSLVLDCAAVRIVVEDRRSAIGSLAAAVRFIRRRFLRVAGLHLLNLIAALALLRFWALLVDQSGSGWLVSVAGPVSLLLGAWTRIALLASETAFFQRELAGPAEAPVSDPVWPEAP